MPSTHARATKPFGCHVCFRDRKCACGVQSSAFFRTAVAVRDVSAEELTVAHCGDSRIVLCRAGKAIDLTEDHKPNLPDEAARIEAAGSVV